VHALPSTAVFDNKLAAVPIRRAARTFVDFEPQRPGAHQTMQPYGRE